METIPRYELLKDAYAIIDGIPDRAIAIGIPCARTGASLQKGTVCDPAGWLAFHPEFRQIGLSITDDGQHLLYNGLGSHDRSVAAVMGMVFAIDMRDAEHLFGPRDDTFPPTGGLTDKEVWLQRLRAYLAAHGQLGSGPTEAQDAEAADPPPTDSQHRPWIEGPNSRRPLQGSRPG